MFMGLAYFERRALQSRNRLCSKRLDTLISRTGITGQNEQSPTAGLADYATEPWDEWVSSRKIVGAPDRAARATGSGDAGTHRASRMTSRFAAPKAAMKISAPARAGSVSVNRRGGGLGESATATTNREASSRAG